MKRIETIKKSSDFQKIINNSKFVKNSYFVIYTFPKPEPNPKFGIAVGKSLGNAVTRNKLKRQIRNIIDNQKSLFPNSHNYIIMIKRNCLNANFSQLEDSFKKLMKEIQ